MKENIEFSVLMSVYKNDNPEYLKIAIDSIINQTLKPNEIVLVVDGPIPDTIKSIIKEYNEKLDYLKIIYLKENGGLGKALNVGLENCTCDIVARMDSDDISLPDRFEKQINEFKKDNSLSIIGGYISEFIDNPEESIGIRKVPLEYEEFSEFIKNRNPLNHMTVMFKKQNVLDAGNYQDFHFLEDYYLWIRMFLKGFKMKNVDSILVNARVGADMYKRRGGWKYFKSCRKLQKYLLENKLITWPKYIKNVISRFIVQVLMPNSLRGFIYKKIMRKNKRF